jgi:DNA-binding winged helix-turn-helix (wHTH) protein/Tol biopolymer transport system component
MQASILHFDQFELDLNSYELRRCGRAIKLEKLPMELLILLAENHGQLVTREQIIQRLWGDNVFVDTRQGINTAIRKIRIALDDDPEHPRLLQTVSGRGYRLLATVSTPAATKEPHVDDAPPALSPPETAAAPVPTRPSPRWQRVLIGAMLAFLAIGLFWLLAPRPMSNRHLTEQRVTSNSPEAPVKFAIISPDGKYVAYSDPTGLYLRVIATGETRRWSVPKDFIANPSSWFPDGTHLLVTCWEGPMQRPSLWKLSVLGGDPRKLIDDGGPGSVSPDGTRIAFVASLPYWGSEIWVMSADGSNPHRVAVATQSGQPGGFRGRIFKPVWSPNSQKIACAERHEVAVPDPVANVSSVWTRDADGKDLQVIVKDAPLGTGLAWTPDGRVLFSSRESRDERDDEGIRSIRVDELTGKPIGQPQVVTDGSGRIGGMSTTSDGKRLLLWRMNSPVQAFITEFDPKTLKWKAPQRLTLDANGNLAEAWLADSKTVLFVSNRNGTWALFRQAIDETTAEVLVEGHDITLPRLSADDSQVLYQSRTEPANYSAPVSLMRLPVAGGSPQLVLKDVGIVNHQCARIPSTLCLFSKAQEGNTVYVSFDPEHGIGHEVLRTSDPWDEWSLSRDGRTLAVFPGDHRIRFFSVENEVAREKKTVTLNDWPVPNGDWTSDGKALLIQSVTAAGIPVMLEVDQAGKASAILTGAANTSFWFMIQAPDGRHGILALEIPGDNNAWMVDNF